MRNLIWMPVIYEPQFTSLGKNSLVFHQNVSGTEFLLVHEENLTFLLVLSTYNQPSVHHVKYIQSEHRIVKITGNNNCVLMLDVEGELYYLDVRIGSTAVPFTCFNGSNVLTSDATVSWQKLCKLSNCLSITGVEDCFISLHHNLSLYTSLYKTDDIYSGFLPISRKQVSQFYPDQKYFLTKFTGPIVNTIDRMIFKGLLPTQEILLIIEPSQIYFLKPSVFGQILSEPYSSDLQCEYVTSVLHFEGKQIILIICKSGKVVCFHFNNLIENLELSCIWLPKPVTAITGYENDVINLIWSDCNNLYISKINHENIIINLQVHNNIRGVRHFVKNNENILALTRNGCIYSTNVRTVKSQELKLKSHELLDDIYTIGKNVERLTKEVHLKESMIQALEMSKDLNIVKDINIFFKTNSLILENKTLYLIKKELWKLQLQKEVQGKKYLETRKLSFDVISGGSVSFELTTGTKNLSVSLICDSLPKVICIAMKLQNVQISSENNEQDIEEQNFRQHLKEVYNFNA